MTTTKRSFSVFLCLLTIFTVLSSTLLQASAYSDTDYYTVTTKANYWYPGSESITVSQSKEEYYSNKAHTKTKKRKEMPWFALLRAHQFPVPEKRQLKRALVVVQRR